MTRINKVGSIKTAADIVVAAAGTAVQGAALPTPNGVIITARAANAGQCYIGDSTVTRSTGAKQGLILVPTGMSPIFLPVTNVNEIWVNADNNGDGVGILVL